MVLVIASYIAGGANPHLYTDQQDAPRTLDCIEEENIAKEIISNAISAATEDYRFNLIEEEELSYLSYTVSILSKPEQIKNLEGLDPKKYGIIVKTFSVTEPQKTEKAGLLLPDLKGIDSVKKQISIVCQKAGINPSKEKVLIYRFTVKKFQ